MKLLTRRGYLIEEQGMVYLAENDSGPAISLRPTRFDLVLLIHCQLFTQEEILGNQYALGLYYQPDESGQVTKKFDYRSDDCP